MHLIGMRFKKTAAGSLVVAFSFITVILAGGFIYEYAVSSSQISDLNSQADSLKQSGREVWQTLQNASSRVATLGTFLENVTSELQDQIRSDRSMIASLNSTKPAGYSSMITLPNSQIAYDLYAISQIQSKERYLRSGRREHGPVSEPSVTRTRHIV